MHARAARRIFSKNVNVPKRVNALKWRWIVGGVATLALVNGALLTAQETVYQANPRPQDNGSQFARQVRHLAVYQSIINKPKPPQAKYVPPQSPKLPSHSIYPEDNRPQPQILPSFFK